MERIVFGKKLSINHSINRNDEVQNIDGKTCFPMITQIIYNRQNTKIRTSNDYSSLDRESSWIYVPEEMANKHSDSEIISIYGLYQDSKILDVIEYEINNSGGPDEYSLRGVGNRLRYYFIPLRYSLEVILKHLLMEKMKTKLVYSAYIEVEENDLGVAEILKLAKSKRIMLSEDFAMVAKIAIGVDNFKRISFYDCLFDDGYQRLQSNIDNFIKKNIIMLDVSYWNGISARDVIYSIKEYMQLLLRSIKDSRKNTL